VLFLLPLETVDLGGILPQQAEHGIQKKVGLRKRSTTATKNYIVETRQGPAPTNVPSEVQCKDRWYVGSLCDQARHQSGM